MWSKCEAEMWCLCYDFSCFQTLAALHLDLYHSKTNSKINLFLQYCNSFARNPILFFALQNWYFSQSLSIFEEKKHRKSRFFTAGRLLCGFLGWLAGLAQSPLSEMISLPPNIRLLKSLTFQVCRHSSIATLRNEHIFCTVNFDL